jgi:hypothetical protein
MAIQVITEKSFAKKATSWRRDDLLESSAEAA